MIRSRMGDTDCTGYLASIFNPVCWVQDPLALQAGMPSPADDAASCLQASGGPGVNTPLYNSCLLQKQSIAAAQAKADPAGAQDYQDVMSGNVFGLLNPFTGSGPLSQTTTGIPTWVFVVGAGAIALAALK